MTSPAAPSWQLATLLGVTQRLTALDPSARLVDTTFPFQRLAYAVTNHIWLPNVLERDAEPHPFFRGFHANSDESHASDLAVLTARLQKKDQTPWLVLDADQANRNALLLQYACLPLLVRGALEDMPALDDAGFSALPFDIAPGRWSGYTTYLPAAQMARLELDPATPTRLDLARVEIPSAIRLNPWDLMTDNGWGAEGDSGFSWIWTGPEICHRICLGDPPAEARGLIVEFIDAPLHQGLADNLLFQINGRTVAADLSGLTGRGGRASLELPAGIAAPLVLGICAFPGRAKPTDGSRHLRVAYDALEVTT